MVMFRYVITYDTIGIGNQDTHSREELAIGGGPGYVGSVWGILEHGWVRVPSDLDVNTRVVYGGITWIS